MSEKSTTSFMRSLCMGQIEEDLLLPFPQIKDAEKDLLSSVVTSLEQMLGGRGDDFRKWDRQGKFPDEFLQELRDFGLFSLVVPEEFGGMEMGAMAYSRVMQELARYDGSVAVTAGAHSSIGMRGLLLFGTEEQCKKYYPKLATGEMIAAFCLTEPGAGSDAAGIKTRAERVGDGWLLTGNKLWITNGGIADFFTVFAKTGEEQERGNITAFIVTRDMEGVSVGKHEDKMGLRASSTTTVHFDDVKLTDAHVLGEPGQGFKVAMKILNSGRTGLGGGSIGAMRTVIELAAKHANERKQFGRPIGSFGLVKQKIGNMIADCYATESVVTLVAGIIDDGHEDYAVEAAISKVYGSEALWRTADEGLQVAGGNGYMCDYPYERIVRDSRINRIFEGTNEVLRLFIALTAMNDVGRELKELAETLDGVFSHPIKGFGVLSDYAVRRASLATGIGPGADKFTRMHSSLEFATSAFETMTRDLARAVDRILRKHGKNIIGKQFATRRLADIMIDLFVLAATLARVSASIEANGQEKAAREVQILRVLTTRAVGRVARNVRGIDENDDELVKSLAELAYEEECYPFDTI